MSSAVPTREFRIRTCLGSGGFGEVYLADMVQRGGLLSTVAVKLLLRDLDPRSQAVARLRDEARILGLLHHPSILAVHDLVTLDGRVGLVAEYVRGADLADAVHREPRIPARPLLEVIAAVADALAMAHRATDREGRPLRLVHRDIKPANIRLSTDGAVKVLDFGIAKAALEGREAKTKTHMLIGSLEYMAPERFDDDADGNLPAGDVFSLGCVLYEGLTGTVLFSRSSIKKQISLAMDPERHTLWTAGRIMRVPGVPPPVLDLLRRMLAHDPSERPTAQEVVEVCEIESSTLEGPTLRQWARERSWPEPGEQDGPLVGRTMTEGTRPVGATGEVVEAEPVRDAGPTPTTPAAPSEAAAGGRWRWVAVVAVLAVVVAGALGCAGIGALVLGGWMVAG